jgi:hypothetical protein
MTFGFFTPTLLPIKCFALKEAIKMGVKFMAKLVKEWHLDQN